MATPAQDWFSQNAPPAQPTASAGGDWFTSNAPPQAQAQPDATTSGAALSTLRDLGEGAVKGLTSTFTGIPAMAGNALNSALGYQKPQRVTDQENYLEPTSTAQQVGKYGEQAAEILLPAAAGGMKLASALDFNAKKQAAGALLQSVAADANKVPVELENSSDAALKLMDWQKKTQLGPTINKFLNRITDPKQGPLTYQDARDFYQLLGKLSVEETNKLAPPVRRNLVQMVTGLKQDIGNAADTVGRAADYYKGLGDYANAAKLEDWYSAAKDYAVKAAVPAGLGALGVGGLASIWKFIDANK